MTGCALTWPRLRSFRTSSHRKTVPADSRRNFQINALERGRLLRGRRPEWGSALAGFFQQRLAAANLTSPAREELQLKLVQFAENPAIQDLLATMAEGKDRVIALSAMARTRAKELPSRWIGPLVRALDGCELEIRCSAILVARAAPPSK